MVGSGLVPCPSGVGPPLLGACGACDAHSAATSAYLVQFAIIVLLFCTAIAVPDASAMLQFS
jgi:hypothetical protein